jgi:hypothetical protein
MVRGQCVSLDGSRTGGIAERQAGLGAVLA